MAMASRLLLVALALVLGASGARAIPLSVLLADPSATIVVGDKEFSDFSYSFTGDMPDAAGVEVLSITDALGNVGLRFQGAFIDLVTPGGSDVLIGFTVSVLDAAQSIVGASLAGNPTLLSGFGSISAVDTFDFDPNLRLTIFDDQEGGTKSVDSITFAAIQSLRVTKDILAFGVKGSATLSFVDQTFEQVPEPAILLLLGLGLAGLGYAGRRRA